MLYALFMIAILIVLAAMWRGNQGTVPLFVVTLAMLSAFLVSDMTTPLALSF